MRGVVSGLNQAEAYRQAYPKSLAWKPEALHKQASELSHLPHVSGRIAELQAAAAEAAGLKATEIQREIRRVALSDIAGIMHIEGKDAGKVKLPHELDAATRAAVSSFKIDEFGRIEYKFWDKNSALTSAAKILGLFEKDNEQLRPPPAPKTVRLVGLKPKKD